MNLKFALAAIAALVLLTNASHVVLSQTGTDRKADEIKSSVQERLRKRKAEVKVEKLDGTKLKGKITEAGDTSFTLEVAKSNQPTVIAYSDTKSVKGGGWPLGAKIALGVGAAAVITFVAFGLAYRNAARNN